VGCAEAVWNTSILADRPGSSNTPGDNPGSGTTIQRSAFPRLRTYISLSQGIPSPGCSIPLETTGPFKALEILPSFALQVSRANSDSKYHILVTNVKNNVANLRQMLSEQTSGQAIADQSGSEHNPAVGLPLAQVVEHLVGVGENTRHSLAM
jgi:hypothetical protein